MAPSTATPTHLRRAAVVKPSPQRPKRVSRSIDVSNQSSEADPAATTSFNSPTHLALPDELVCTDRPPTSTGPRAKHIDNCPKLLPQHQKPVITNTVRARIIEALATLKGKRGAPFSFVTGGNPLFSTRTHPNIRTARDAQHELNLEPSQTSPLSLKISWLLRPLRISHHDQTPDDDRQPDEIVKMPSYIASMTLGQTITDPIEGGVISLQASKLLFRYFMVQMNAKWEYLLDPYFDTHDSVQQRSSLLFSSILFCASKFASYTNGRLVSHTDPFLQSRLCSLSRNLVIRAIAGGDRSVETMQALYLLVCWKDPDDDISYLHSGYAFSILRDLDLESSDGDDLQVARRRRIWLALFRQDRQQSLFFLRKASLSHGDDESSFLCNIDTWLKMPYTLPSDFFACCSADLRRIQSKLRTLVQKASSVMLPCLLDLMDSELTAWRSKWWDHVHGEGKTHSTDDPSLYPELLHPGGHHLTALVRLWEQSVRLNISSAILRQSLMASMASSLQSNCEPNNVPLDLDLTTIQHVLSPSLPGLSSSVESAFGTLNSLIKFPPADLRRAPDAILLLGPNAALFVCLLLCLPELGILGPTFQRTAVDLIRSISNHVKQCVESPQDTVALHSNYLDSLVELLHPPSSTDSDEQHEISLRPTHASSHMLVDANGLDIENANLQATHTSEVAITEQNYSMSPTDAILGFQGSFDQTLHMQSLGNLLDGDLFWEMPPETGDANIGS
ncbi:hypothetical protein PHISCL_02568 [Aspergillus sclerotialis]|uniref:Xylanolytic transcriptional activator regulatory domain-containing protein n=1 Tax=Aspergillus sclerotialis TaxID=2070753 RepID=A0A3A2ZUP6_9EURO|nr:hypothetical protein PHISCL_02568 [Aspergillus sclerotialis]